MSRRIFVAAIAYAAIVAESSAGDAASSRADWASFRGNAQLTGVARCELPARPGMAWKVDLKEPVTATAAIVDDTAYVGCDDGNLYALALADGTRRWTYKAGEAIRSSAAVHDGTVYVGDQAGVFHAVDARTGQIRWTFTAAGEIVSSPTIAENHLVFGSYDGFVYGLNRTSGELAWKFHTDGRVHGTPSVMGENVIVAGCDEYVHVISLSDGVSVRRIGAGSVSGASAALDGDSVYVPTYGNCVLGINWREGRILWKFQDPDREFPFLSSAAIGQGVIYVAGRDKRLRALDAGTGEVKWTFTANGKMDSSPVLVGDRIFIGSADGNLYAVKADTGAEVWRFEGGAPISASPAIGRGCLVIGDEDGVVYCFGGK
ncbi:MAG: PQQ-binding-like beta-propeller repeat protein [Planctomycetota bacterium]